MPDRRPPPLVSAHRKKKLVSLAREITLTTGSRSDWSYFARWHYRSHHLGIVRYVTLMWFRDEPIGICVFTSAPLSLRGRNRFFGLRGKWSRLNFQTLNRQLVMLSRVVLHPSFRGAGLAAPFIRRSCESAPWPWIETLTEMGRLNPFFEKAGFTRVDAPPARKSHSRSSHSAIYGTKGDPHAKKPLVTQETFQKSRYSQPVYYIFDNRPNVPRRQPDA